MTVRSTVIAQIEAVGRERQLELPSLSDDLLLMDSGLDSLCMAILVARLEDELGVDPFTTNEDAPYPQTVGELVAFYEDACR